MKVNRQCLALVIQKAIPYSSVLLRPTDVTSDRDLKEPEAPLAYNESVHVEYTSKERPCSFKTQRQKLKAVEDKDNMLT